MWLRSFRLFELLVLLYTIEQITSTVEFTNVKCTSLDPDFADFEYCLLKSVNRTYKYVSLKVKLFKLPVTKIKVNVELMKRYNGYKPFLYNVTVDACRFLKNPTSNPIAAYMYDSFKDHSNMNHTCPFNHDVILDKLSINFINQRVTDVLPFPPGDYLFQSKWLAYDINRANVNVTSTVEFTNIKCNTLDPKFDEFEYCYLKSVNRTYKYLSLKAKIYQLPVTKVTVNFELMKRFSGYKPFLYNVTVDACRVLKNPKSSPIAIYFYGAFKGYSNMNHTCPIDHDIIVDKLSIDYVNQYATKVLPFPPGDYLLKSNWIAYDINRASVDVYLTLS